MDLPTETQSRIEEEIRRDKLSTFNRLHSIAEDAAWVQSIAKHYGQFPIAPNQRCGAWYVDPVIVSFCFFPPSVWPHNRDLPLCGAAQLKLVNERMDLLQVYRRPLWSMGLQSTKS